MMNKARPRLPNRIFYFKIMTLMKSKNTQAHLNKTGLLHKLDYLTIKLNGNFLLLRVYHLSTMESYRKYLLSNSKNNYEAYHNTNFRKCHKITAKNMPPIKSYDKKFHQTTMVKTKDLGLMTHVTSF